MKKILIAALSVFFMLPSICLSSNGYIIKTSTSDIQPPVLEFIQGYIRYNFNCTEEAPYVCSYVEIEPPITKAKVLTAINSDQTILTLEEAPDVVDDNDVINARLDEIGQMTWEEIDTHIDTVFSGLSVAQRTSLKRLYKCVLALIKIR
jgi:hypothetical protein